ncbi:DUF2002 family protein [Enterobacter sp. CPE_E1241]|uniref:DUF2002 family protein n=1 Tax=Enterobacter sp. CPE_E1241 TaxID=3376801 RepID=UPI00388D6B0A
MGKCALPTPMKLQTISRQKQKGLCCSWKHFRMLTKPSSSFACTQQRKAFPAQLMSGTKNFYSITHGMSSWVTLSHR